LFVEEPSQTHVQNLDTALAIQKKVPRLDISMNHPQFVAVL
jgi:hypothetical protein